MYTGRVVQMLHIQSLHLNKQYTDFIPQNTINNKYITRNSCNNLINYKVNSNTQFEMCSDDVTFGGNIYYGPTYHAMHIRRGDFQYDFTKISAEAVIVCTYTVTYC